jgi:hypothetical protein
MSLCRSRRALLAALAVVVLSVMAAGTASAAVQQPTGGPILVVTSSGDPFSSYNTEILRNEGFNDFGVVDVSSMTSQLAGHSTVILAESTLTDAQVSALTTWVGNGGNLIAMRPDKKLAGLLGLTDDHDTLANGNLQIDGTQAPGAGITTSPLQFHDTADLYELNGARAIATFTPSGQPAVTTRAVGLGHAAAFTYDLARSVVYTRQGNPSWAGQNRDEFAVGPDPDPVTRSNDLFFGDAFGDPQPDWVDLNRVAIPQADEQQRLLDNMIVQYSTTPTPRFWYLPNGDKAAIAMTGDDHGGGETTQVFQDMLALGPTGCHEPVNQTLLASWQCPRSTSYIYPDTTPIDPSQATQLSHDGFEFAVHPLFDSDGSCLDFTPSTLDATVSREESLFEQAFPGLTSKTVRTHCISWSDWASQPKVDLAHGMRLNADYYYFPAVWTQNRPGMFTGSGFPMRFADCDGSLIDVYQATTYAADDATNLQGGPDVANTAVPAMGEGLIDNALGANGYYGAFTIQVHTDDPGHDQARNDLVQYAMAHGVPVISEAQLLTWLDGRNASSFQSINYAANGQMSFTITQGSGATGLQAMLPAQGLTGLTRNGSAVTFTTQTIKGVSYAMFSAAAGNYVAQYPAPAAGQGGAASTFTGSITGGTGSSGGTCESAGDPGTNPPGDGGGNNGGGNNGGGNNGGGNNGGGTNNGGGGTNNGGTNNGGTGSTGTGSTTPLLTETSASQTSSNEKQKTTPSTTTAFVTTSGASFRPGAKRSYVLTVRLKRDARLVLTFRTPKGKIVRQIRIGTRKAGSVIRIAWNGRDSRGRFVAPSKYGFTLTAVGKHYLRTSRGSVKVLTAR